MPRSGLYAFPFLVLVFALITAASWILAERSFTGVFSGALFSSPEGLFFLVVAPLALLALIAIILVGTVSESLHTEGASRLRLRVFFSFSLLLVAVAIPESVIVGKFASSALGSWFDRSIPDSMNVAVEMADLYTEERIADIEAVSERYLSGLAISNWRARPSDWMAGIRQIDRHAVACQVYLRTDVANEPVWSAVMESGNSLAFVAKDRLGSVPSGLFTLSDEEPWLRWGETVRYGNSVYLCVYTTSVPPSFDSDLDSVRDAWERSRAIDTLRPFFPWLGIWIFAVFLLPSLGMVLVLAWQYACRLSARVKTQTDALGSLAGGDARVRLIPAGKDELSQGAEAANAIALLLAEAKSRGSGNSGDGGKPGDGGKTGDGGKPRDGGKPGGTEIGRNSNSPPGPPRPEDPQASRKKATLKLKP